MSAWWYGLAAIDWRAPLWALIALQPWLAWALVRWRRRAVLRYADAHLRPWALRRPGRGGAARFGLNALAWLLLGAAMAGPRVLAPAEVPGEGPRGDIALMVVLDVSPSMYTEDVSPRRLQRAVLEVENLLERLRGERVGLIAVAGQPLLLAPPTADRAVLRHYLQRAPQALRDVPGTALAPGLALAREALAAAGGGAVVLITDGDADALGDARWDAVQATAAALHTTGMPLYVLGVGTTEGAPVPDGRGGYLRYGGETVVSRMDESRLRALAAAGGGRYVSAGRFGQDWRTLYDGGAARLPSTATADARAQQWRELYGWFLVPALVLLGMSWLRVQPRRTGGAGVHRGLRALITLALIGLWMPLQSGTAWADDRARDPEQGRAYSIYENGNYALALVHYARLPGYAARMGEGASAYRLRDYEHAEAAYARAWLEAPGDRERAEALSNLGNARFRQQRYADAVEAYRDALRYPSPHQERIAQNLERARAQAEALEPGDEGVPGRRSRYASEDLGRMDESEETPDFPEDEAPADAATAEDEREALGEAVARGELLPDQGSAGGLSRRQWALDREYAAALKKLEHVEDRDLRVLRSLRDRESPPERSGGAMPW